VNDFVWMPEDAGNEDDEFLSLLERAAFNTSMTACKCSHPEMDHVDDTCVRRACGCIEFRPRQSRPEAATRGQAA